MRWLLATLLLRSALGVEPAIGPLLDRESDRAQVISALEALSRGDASGFTILPAAVFMASVGLPEPGDADLIRRWTSAVPAALARLNAEMRASAVAVLDQRCLALMNDTSDAPAKARIATAFMPAPSAIAYLQRNADRAFDHGDFRIFLSITAIVGNADSTRDEVSLALLGAGPSVAADAALRIPGIPMPNPVSNEIRAQLFLHAMQAMQTLPNRQPTPVVRVGLSVDWRVVPGWLLALDPWQEVRWQYRLEPRAEVVTGDGGALVRDGRGLRLIDENGIASALPPAPRSAHLLSVSGGAAWFSTDRHVYRMDLTDRRLTSATLPAVPLAGPVVRGVDSLWLTSDELVLLRGMTVEHHVRHGLKAGPGWSLSSDGDRPAIIALDGHSWHVEALQEQLNRASPADRLALLMQAGRLAEAIAVFANEQSLAADPASRRLALLAHLGSGSEHVRTAADGILALTASAQERATVLAALGRDENLTALCAEHPDLLIPRGDSAWDGEPATWSHVLAARAWSDRDGLTTWLALAPDLRSAVVPQAQAGTDRDQPERRGDGSWRIGPRTVRCESGLTSTTLECRGGDGSLRWRHRWPALDALAAPGRSLVVRDTWIVLVEGAARLRVLDLGNGALLADLDLHGADIAPETVVPLGGGSVADLGPLGINAVLHLRGTKTVDVPLPSPARWIVPWGVKVLVSLSDGRFLAFPGATEVDLPEPLRRGPTPSVSSLGLEASGQCWPWAR